MFLKQGQAVAEGLCFDAKQGLRQEHAELCVNRAAVYAEAAEEAEGCLTACVPLKTIQQCLFGSSTLLQVPVGSSCPPAARKLKLVRKKNRKHRATLSPQAHLHRHHTTYPACCPTGLHTASPEAAHLISIIAGHKASTGTSTHTIRGKQQHTADRPKCTCTDKQTDRQAGRQAGRQNSRRT